MNPRKVQESKNLVSGSWLCWYGYNVVHQVQLKTVHRGHWFIAPWLFRLLVNSAIEMVEYTIVCLPPVAHDGRIEMLQMSTSVHDVTGAATKKPPELG